MKKVLIAYASRTGKTKKMAEYVAEGVRMGGDQPEIKKISEIKDETELQGYDAYVFGSPTYHGDMIPGMKNFLFLADKAGLKGKVGGAFGSHTHTGEAPKLIYDTMEYVFKMDMTALGPFKLTEATVEEDEGMRACQHYGKAISEQLSK